MTVGTNFEPGGGPKQYLFRPATAEFAYRTDLTSETALPSSSCLIFPGYTFRSIRGNAAAFFASERPVAESLSVCSSLGERYLQFAVNWEYVRVLRTPAGDLQCPDLLCAALQRIFWSCWYVFQRRVRPCGRLRSTQMAIKSVMKSVSATQYAWLPRAAPFRHFGSQRLALHRLLATPTSLVRQ